ncbi:armadillo-type protein [Talaromyces proteolyticus]|uniref:Armadillo-type protein n=1 Tax=Talaromyces proteolyticus TaxID=1131652 RepID=A0AAD4KT01_9EURO|nr:armadillo-type protein [Talaromyces proteolyticus]KAH8697647.1 armadillo-type protein [Talaromyces proteolyticus]
MRDKMRALDTSIKADFIQKNRTESSCPNSATSSTFDSAGRRGRKDAGTNSSHGRDKSARSRSRGRSPFSMSRGDLSPSKKHQKSDSTSSTKRPKSIELARPYSSMLPGASASVTSLQAAAHTDTSADPADFIHYLREVQKPELVEVGKLHKLRLLLRNETVSWVDSFIADNGMDEVIQLLYRIMAVEWREDHEDTLLHETLLCLKALCTTSLALQRLTLVAKNLFPALLSMLFDDEKKGPSEFTTRGIIISLLFTYLSTASTQAMSECASEILTYLRDPCPETQQVDFIANIYQPRPYRVWSKEVTNVTKEVFWIFLHHLNVIPIASRDDSIIDQEQDYVKRHFPVPRPPVPAAPYVGGVEWDATNYLAAHLDLMNGLIACQPTREQRNTLREELRASGFEKVMGGSMRTCKEKFYGAVHDCLKTWVSAAREDGWDYRFVREGPEPGSPAKSPTKSPQKKRVEEPPKIALAIDLEKKAPAKEADLDGWI